MAFSTALNLHGKFDTGINVLDAQGIPGLPFDLENVLGVHRLKIACNYCCAKSVLVIEAYAVVVPFAFELLFFSILLL